jgi:hypothetical protein
MSAEVLGSVPASEAEPAVPAAREAAASALLDPSLVNRLLGVAAAVFAVPVLVGLRVLAGGAGAPSAAALASTLVAAALLAAGFGGMLLRAPRTHALRTGRALAGLLAAEAAVLALALAARLAA